MIPILEIDWKITISLESLKSQPSAGSDGSGPTQPVVPTHQFAAAPSSAVLAVAPRAWPWQARGEKKWV